MTIQTKYKAGDYVFISYNKLKDLLPAISDISDYPSVRAFTQIESMTPHQDFPLYGIITGVAVSATEGLTTRGVVAKTVETFYKIKILSPSYMRTSVYTSDRYFPEVDNFYEEDVFSSFEEMEECLITNGCYFLQKGLDKEDIKQIIKDNEI